MTRETIIELAKAIKNKQSVNTTKTEKQILVHGKTKDFLRTQQVNIDVDKQGKHFISEETENSLRNAGFSDNQIRELKDKLSNITSLDDVKELILEAEEEISEEKTPNEKEISDSEKPNKEKSTKEKSDKKVTSNKDKSNKDKSDKDKSKKEITLTGISKKATQLQKKIKNGTVTSKEITNLCTEVDNYEKDSYKVKGDKTEKLKQSLTLMNTLYGSGGIFTELINGYEDNPSEQDRINLAISLDYYRKMRGRQGSRFTKDTPKELLDAWNGTDGIRNVIQQNYRYPLAIKLGVNPMVSTAEIDSTLEINGINIKDAIVTEYVKIMGSDKPIVEGTEEYTKAKQYIKDTYNLVKTIETEINNETNATRKNALIKARQKAVDTMASVIKSLEHGGALTAGESLEYYTQEVLLRSNKLDNVTIAHIGGNLSKESDIKITYKDNDIENNVYIECKALPARLGSFNLDCVYKDSVLVHVDSKIKDITPAEQKVLDFVNNHLKNANLTEEQVKSGINMLETLQESMNEEDSTKLQGLINNALVEHYSHGSKNAPVVSLDYMGKQYFIPTEKLPEIFTSKTSKNGRVINPIDYNIRFKDSGNELSTSQQAYINSVLSEPSTNKKLKTFINENSMILDNKKSMDIPNELLPNEYQGLGFRLLKTTAGETKIVKEGKRIINELVHGDIDTETLKNISIDEKDVIKYVIDKDKANKKTSKKKGNKNK